jgi:hypothetical protein
MQMRGRTLSVASARFANQLAAALNNLPGELVRLDRKPD